jgi:exopolysaccharide biosynthesis polyprenyl glycosylphosphotransferase
MRRYQRTLLLIDLLAAISSVLVGSLVNFGTLIPPFVRGDALLGAMLPIAWVIMVAINRAYESRAVGVGATEFQRISHAFLHLIALVGVVAFAARLELSRAFIVIALPMIVVLDLIGRYGARKWLHRQRSCGRSMSSVLAVGDAPSIADFVALVRRDRYAGMRVVGACLPSDLAQSGDSADALGSAGVPLLGNVDSVLKAARLSGANTVAVVSSATIGPEKLRWISWQLEGTDINLVVSPGLMEVAGPRLHIQPVAGLPLLHVEQPQFSGFRRVLKSAFDRISAAVALLALSPIFLGLMLAVRLTTRGPALFRQVRIGRDGSSFTMLKFRSMYADAESRKAELHTANVNADGLLFKIPNDPRITPIGRMLRKFSLDELPQLLNIVSGKMSLVGPRPPLPSEVERYEDHVRRRLLVKPGLTGLWQISGRSDLAWDEAVRLDLRYVENWSIALDLLILWKTVFAVVRGAGAY